MRRLLFVCIAILITNGLQAQTFGEWFRQKATQKKYLIEQIAALKVYSTYLKKGYDIGREGLTAISDIKNGDFDLHRDFFSALHSANPEVRRYAPVSATVQLQQRILRICREAGNLTRTSPELSATEKDYFNGVVQRVLADCDRIGAELQQVTTGAELSLKDDERLKRIDKLYAETQDAYSFARSFCGQYASLVTARKKMKSEVETSLKLSGTAN